MKRLSLIALMFTLVIGTWADNNIILSSVQGNAGTEVTVSVSMTNSDAVSALQLSIPLDDNLTFIANSQKGGTRLNGHSLSAGVKEGVLNLMVYSVSMATVSGNEGEVLSFKLLLGNNPGTVTLEPSSTALTGIDGSPLTSSAYAGTIDIRGAKIQFENSTLDFDRVGINESSGRSFCVQNVGNEMLTITGIVFQSPIFTTTTSLPLTINAGSSRWIPISCQPVARGVVDEEMTIVSNSTSGNGIIRLKAIPYGVNELSLGNASGSTDEEVTIPVFMKNYDEISGLQMEINMPDGLEYVDGSFVLSDRKKDHALSATGTDGVLTIVAYSPSDKAFKGNDGEVGSFKVKITGSNNVNLYFDKAMLSSTIDDKTTDVLSGSHGCTVSVASPNMYANSSLDFGKFSINELSKQKSFTISNFGSAPLIINNIAFANRLFSVKEQLPLTIDTYSNKTITVECVADADGDISTDMEIYTNDPNKRLYIVKINGSIYTPDYLSATVDGTPNEVNLNLSLNNYSDIYGVQFDIITSIDFMLSSENIELTDRCKGFITTVNAIGDGRLRVMAYTMNDKYISSGEGKVMTIKLIPKASFPDGQYNMTINNITLGSKGMQNIYAGKDITLSYGVGEPVTVTAVSYTRVYGDANPEFKFTSEGAALAGMPEITCEATATSPVGTYPIVITKGGVTNYNDRYVNGTLTITKAPLSVKSGTYSKKQGEENPQFTLTYEGFKNDETEAVLTAKPAATTTATKESEPGEYAITVSGGEATNYELSYTNGKLTVTDADPVTITALSYTREYGQENPIFEYTSEGAELVGIPEITCEATETSPVGTYPIVVTMGSVENYNVIFVNGTLTVTKPSFIMGDANGDKVVDVADIVAIVNCILGEPGAGFVRSAADLNGDGKIDVEDVVAVVNIILDGGGHQNMPAMRRYLMNYGFKF